MRALLVVLGALAVIAGTTGLTGAALTGARQEPAADVQGGSLDLTLTQEGTSILDASDLRPGSTRAQTIALRNAGNVPAGSVTLAVRDHVDTPPAAGLSAVLGVKLEDCGADAACGAPTLAYSGSLRDLTAASLGGIAAGAARHVRVTLTWDPTKADPARQGAQASALLVWTAVAGASA